MRSLVAVSSLLWIIVVRSHGDETISGKLTLNGDFLMQRTGSPVYPHNLPANSESLYSYTDDWGAWFFSEQDENTSSYGSFTFVMDDDSGATPRFRIIPKSSTATELLSVLASGNIGINRSSPNCKLDIWEPTLSRMARFDGTYGKYDFLNTSLRFTSTITNGNSHLYLNDKDNNDSRNLIEALGNAGSIDAFMVTSSGKVGIGTRTPANALEVNGTIRSKEVIVETTGWPDYVFEDGYDLPTLEEVESHIIENGHLPGVDPAEEVDSDGQSLGETQRLMMQKIEELTLYVIELKKENDEQQKEIEKLRKRRL